MKRAWGAPVLIAAAVLSGCSDSRSDGSIVVTTNILGDVVTEIVGDEASVEVLMPPNADPHVFGISSRRAEQMESAALVVFSGRGLEGGLLHHVGAAAEHGVPTLEVVAAVLDDAEDDPHFWTDPRHMAVAVEVIASAVIDDVPGVDAAVIRERADRYAAELLELHEWSAGQLRAVPSDRRQLVTNHHVFGYFAAAYDLDVVGAILPSATTLASPSAQDLESLADAIRTDAVPAIFVETSHPGRLAEVLADEAGIDVQILELYSESLGPSGSPADTYLRMMRFNVEQIVTGLTGDAP